MGTVSRHLTELEHLLSGNGQAEVLPHVPSACRHVLDVGCGCGQVLIAAHLQPAILAVAVDIDPEALKLGAQLTHSVRFVRGAAEELPFPADSFDYVISRVALPYTNIPVALGEIARVLRPRGELWVTLHPVTVTLKEIWRSTAGTLDLKALVGRVFVLANGLSLHLLSRVFPFPANRYRYESFQTARGMTRALHHAGFRQVEIRQERNFVVTARKPA